MSEHSTSAPLFEQSQPVEMSLYDLIKAGMVKVHHKSPCEVRFWSRVNKDGPEHPTLGKCWLWTGRTQFGYGIFRVISRKVRAHRCSYVIHFGAIADEECVLHRCDNPACVNPGHLFLGSHTDNNADMVRKGRNSRGESRPASKLTEDQVAEIRRRYFKKAQGHGNGAALGREFGVSKATIGNVVRGESWKYLQ